MKYKSHKGWYQIRHKEKFIKPIDEYMESCVQKDGYIYIQYKSMLERIAFRYADMNPKVKYFSIEPFNIPYVKPLDNKVHRYFIDMYLEFINGSKFIVEIKSKGETIRPIKPKKFTAKSILNYKESIETFVINQAKWKSAQEFAKQKNLKFIILTEEQLK